MIINGHILVLIILMAICLILIEISLKLIQKFEKQFI